MYTLKCIVEADTPTANDTVYPEAVLTKAFEKYNEEVKNGSALVTLHPVRPDHPVRFELKVSSVTKNCRRIPTQSPRRICGVPHRIRHRLA